MQQKFSLLNRQRRTGTISGTKQTTVNILVLMDLALPSDSPRHVKYVNYKSQIEFQTRCSTKSTGKSRKLQCVIVGLSQLSEFTPKEPIPHS